VLRRGGSTQFCVIDWDLRNDDFRVGQWCKHKLYPHRCDISPDGRWFVYFALNGRWKDEATKGAWTGLSQAPYLKAVKMWPNGSTWGGGGLFFADRSSDGFHRIHDRLRLGSGTYFNRLARDGWTHMPAEKNAGKAFEKPMGNGYALRKKVRGEELREAHQLRTPDEKISDLPGWQWAEVDSTRKRVVWAKDGVLFAARIERKGLGEPKQLFDACPMTFEAIRAPYDRD
jgi:hypothetical protein